MHSTNIIKSDLPTVVDAVLSHRKQVLAKCVCVAVASYTHSTPSISNYFTVNP